jgi:hypothetical protein
LAAITPESKVLSVAIEAAGTMPKTKDGPLTDRSGTAGLHLDKRTQDFSVPALGVFDVEDRMECEIKTFFGWDAKPL